MKLNQAIIRRELGNHFPGNIVVKERTSSTQKLAQQADPGVPKAFLSEEQTNGYGKNNRSFYSPRGSGLYLSVLIPGITAEEMTTAGLFTTGLANAIATLLERYYPGKQLGVKWVNDVLLGSAKVCGILVEAQMQGASISWIVGIGINLTTTNFPPVMDRVVGSMSPNQEVDRNQLAADLIKTIWHLRKSYRLGKFIPEYQQRLVLMNRQVTLTMANTDCSGIVRGIDQQGRLLLELENGAVQRFNAGEVTKVKY